MESTEATPPPPGQGVVSHTGYRAEVIADSVNKRGGRLTTMEITFPRPYLAEFNTHRRFSRNSASSRAIPVEKMLARVQGAVYYSPLVWASEQPGMSGGTELQGQDLEDAMTLWQNAHRSITELVEQYLQAHPDKKTRLHKSLINRLLEPFMWHTVIVSSTEWENFFNQRCHPAAQPEIRKVAEMMRDQLEASEPTYRRVGEVHLPYVAADEHFEFSIETLIKLSVARCARVSYLNHDGVRDPQEDIRMFDETLWSNGHWSPMEHVAVVTDAPPSSNFGYGWTQARWYAENNAWEVMLDIVEEVNS